MASMVANNNIPAPPAISSTDIGIETSKTNTSPLGINTGLSPDNKDDTGKVANKEEDAASSVTITDAAHPDVDDETGPRDAIQAINSGVGDAKCLDSFASSEKIEHNEGAPHLDEAGFSLTELGQEQDTEVANTPSIDTDAPPHTDDGIGFAVNNENPASDSEESDSSEAESSDTENSSENEEKDEERTPILDKYGTNLTKIAEEGKLTPFDGREELVERMIQILCRKTKCNPCLIGHPGFWKTAIVEGLAQRIQSNNVPERLKGKKLVSITSEPESETYCSKDLGEEIIEEIKECKDILVYFDEGHTIHSRVELKQALAKGDIQCISATETMDEYTSSSSLTRVFQKMEVPEPSMDDTLKVLKKLRESYETHHKVRYTNEAFDAALKLASRYLSNDILLDAAIDLIDEAGSRVQLRKLKTAENNHVVGDTPILVTKEDVQHVVSFLTGIPVHEVSKEESELLQKLEETLHKSIIGQHKALVAIANAIRRSRVGLKSPKRPIASFILARQYFGSEDSMVRFDMSEYMERHEVSKLIGSPPGYIGSEEGGQLTEAIRLKPHTVILFDEIEKAHPDIMNIMLQILEDGRLTDNKGVTVKFSNTIIIMTSNVGGNVILSESSSGVSDDKIYKLVMKEIKKIFRAEFLNRFDEIIVFKQLTKGEVNQIADLMFKELGETLMAKDIKLNVSDRFRKKVVHDGYSPSYGARQLRRVITTLLENPLATKMLSKEIKDGDSVSVDVDSEGNIEVITEPRSLLGE